MPSTSRCIDALISGTDTRSCQAGVVETISLALLTAVSISVSVRGNGFRGEGLCPMAEAMGSRAQEFFQLVTHDVQLIECDLHGRAGFLDRLGICAGCSLPRDRSAD